MFEVATPEQLLNTMIKLRLKEDELERLTKEYKEELETLKYKSKYKLEKLTKEYEMKLYNFECENYYFNETKSDEIVENIKNFSPEDSNLDILVDPLALKCQDLYSTTGLIEEAGFFKGGPYPDMYDTIKDPDGRFIKITTPEHDVVIGMIKYLSYLLSKCYENENGGKKNPIGLAKKWGGKFSKSRGNCFPLDPVYLKCVEEFMYAKRKEKGLEYTNYQILCNPTILVKYREDKENKLNDKNTNRIEKYLNKKQFIYKKINKLNPILVSLEQRQELQNEFLSYVEKCRIEKPKNVEMNVFFKNFKSKIDKLK